MNEAPAPAEIGPPHMSPAELAAFRDWLRGGARCYGEFGMGGSTLEASRVGFDAIVAVDSDRRWVQSVRAHPEIAPGIAAGRIAALHGDIGPTREWGNPLDDKAVKQWPRYIQAGWAEWAKRGQSPDLLFVDGRFRVACALSGLLTRDDPTRLRVMVHDMLPERMGSYGPILEFYEPLAQAESLWLLQPKPGLDRAALLGMFLSRLLEIP
jgi:hypothetical protein